MYPLSELKIIFSFINHTHCLFIQLNIIYNTVAVMFITSSTSRFDL